MDVRSDMFQEMWLVCTSRKLSRVVDGWDKEKQKSLSETLKLEDERCYRASGRDASVEALVCRLHIDQQLARVPRASATIYVCCFDSLSSMSGAGTELVARTCEPAVRRTF